MEKISSEKKDYAKLIEREDTANIIKNRMLLKMTIYREQERAHGN